MALLLLGRGALAVRARAASHWLRPFRERATRVVTTTKLPAQACNTRGLKNNTRGLQNGRQLLCYAGAAKAAIH